MRFKLVINKKTIAKFPPIIERKEKILTWKKKLLSQEEETTNYNPNINYKTLPMPTPTPTQTLTFLNIKTRTA